MEWQYKRALVAGTGKSGIGAANLLLSKGMSVIFFDENENVDKDKILNQCSNKEHVSFVLGAMNEQALSQTDCMVISPGIPVDAAFTELVRTNNIPIISEIELAYQFGKGQIVAITGTNGKTTTTALTGEIMRAYFESVFVVGNIGTPYTSVVNEMKNDTVTVAEISSFQLETAKEFHPKVSAVLNVTPDHLNRHKTMEIYSSVKESISKNQNSDDVFVLNYDDEITKAMADRAKAKVVFFSRKQQLNEGVFLKNDAIVLKEAGKEIEVCLLKDLKLLGTHNVENVMAAVAMSYYMQVPVEVIRQVVTSFMGVEHRIEYVVTVDGVDYYNDSKGTNPDAAIKGIQAMTKKTVLIGGGYDKGVAFDEWIKSFDGKVKKLILMGVTAQMIADTATKYGFSEVLFVSSLEEAVKLAHDEADEGEAVLLSPACASWDMFDSYEQRGDMFKEFVKQLKG